MKTPNFVSKLSVFIYLHIRLESKINNSSQRLNHAYHFQFNLWFQSQSQTVIHRRLTKCIHIALSHHQRPG